MAEIPWSHKHLKDVFLKNPAQWNWSLKVTVMQIEKALKNDCLHVPKVSWKFCIPTISNFPVIYLWNLLFS